MSLQGGQVVVSLSRKPVTVSVMARTSDKEQVSFIIEILHAFLSSSLRNIFLQLPKSQLCLKKKKKKKKGESQSPLSLAICNQCVASAVMKSE